MTVKRIHEPIPPRIEDAATELAAMIRRCRDLVGYPTWRFYVMGVRDALEVVYGEQEVARVPSLIDPETTRPEDDR